MAITAKYRKEGYPNEWWLTDYAMEQVERHIAYLEHLLEGYKKDAEYLRKWREIKGRNPGMHCCCEFDEDLENQIEWCSVHAEMRDRLEELEKIVEEYKKIAKDIDFVFK